MAHRIDGLVRKQEILQAASKVFVEKGYIDTSMAEICKQAKTNAVLIRYYFGSIEELYIEVWRDALQAVMDKGCPYSGGSDD